MILAGITLSITLGENGIFAKSKEAVDKYKEAAKAEQNELDSIYDTFESLDPNSLAAHVKVGDYVSYTPKSGTNAIIEQGSYDGYKEYSNSTGYLNWNTINENGETTGKGELGSGYTGEAEQIFEVPTDTSAIKWRVLSVENGCVNLISEKEIGRNGLWTGDWGDTLYLQDITGYAYGVDVINKVCSIYGTGEGAKGARGITVEDVNKITGYSPVNDKDYSSKYGNLVKLDNYENKWKWTYYYYRYDKNGMNLRTADKTSTEYKLIFDSNLYDNKNNPTTKNNYAYYWLASRCVGPYSDNASFYLRYVDYGSVDSNDLFYCYSGGSADYNDSNYPVRPVVSLKSSVKVDSGDGKIGTPYTFKISE